MANVNASDIDGSNLHSLREVKEITGVFLRPLVCTLPPSSVESQEFKSLCQVRGRGGSLGHGEMDLFSEF
jgi:hypothetical protein